MNDEDQVAENEVIEDVLDDEEVPSILDDMDDDEELFPGGPTAAQARAWKEEYGKVISITIGVDEIILFRPLTRDEYRNQVLTMERVNAQNNLSAAQATLRNEEILASIVMLYPEYNPMTDGDKLAGVPTIVSDYVMAASGFNAIAVQEL